MATTPISFTVKYRRNYTAELAVLLFLHIIAGEIAMATLIPVAMRNENLMAAEAERNDLIQLFDQTRLTCNAISGKNSAGMEDNLILTEKQLISDVLDRFARYMRNEGARMTPEEVTRVRAIVQELYKAVSRLAAGQSYSRENRLDTANYINTLLKQTNGEIRRDGKKK